MIKLMFSLLFVALLSCSGQPPETDENPALSAVINQFFSFMESENYEGAAFMLTPYTVDVMSGAIKDDLQAKKHALASDSSLKDRMNQLYGIPLEEVISKNDTQLIALYFQKLPKYFELDRDFIVLSEKAVDSCKAFISVRYQNGAIDTLFFEKHSDEWKIDLSYLVKLNQFKAQALENAHAVQLAAEEFLFFADSRGYPLTIEEMNLPQGLTNPFNGDTAFLIFKENADKSEDPDLEGYVT
ncbi:hypothetical protein JW890_04635, partial [candidate division WOR-3 bacterium]|nr:hypothetical protein [candidate division WOR-3 bacterium]